MTSLILDRSVNPFSSRFIRPGAIPYLCHDGRNLDELARQFLKGPSRQAAIVGPHGSGKSTMLATLHGLLERDWQVFAYRFTVENRNDIDRMRGDSNRWGPQSIVLVDGYEQQSRWSRWKIRRQVRQRECRLLITAHSVLDRLPVLWRTCIDEELARSIRDSLLATRPELLDHQQLESRWQAARRNHPTDLRETWMTMYDWVEEEKQKRLASQ